MQGLHRLKPYPFFASVRAEVPPSREPRMCPLRQEGEEANTPHRRSNTIPTDAPIPPTDGTTPPTDGLKPLRHPKTPKMLRGSNEGLQTAIWNLRDAGSMLRDAGNFLRKLGRHAPDCWVLGFEILGLCPEFWGLAQTAESFGTGCWVFGTGSWVWLRYASEIPT